MMWSIIKGIIRAFKSKENYLFYYLIDAWNFLIRMICINPPLVAYVERNSLFNFDKMVFGNVKTAMDSPALSTSFENNHPRLRIFTALETKRTKTSGTCETKLGINSKTVVKEQKKIQKRHSVNRQ